MSNKLDELFLKLRSYLPAGSGSVQVVGNETKFTDIGLQLSLEGASIFVECVNDILSLIGGEPGYKLPIHDLLPEDPETELTQLFNKYKSDKGLKNHRFDIPYKLVLDETIARFPHVNLLEIGLGTNNPDIVSTMGVGGSPGASLRAFRDYIPNGNIFGADIDKRVLFQEDRIRTEYVDQLDTRTFNHMYVRFDQPDIHIFIDDGLHSLPSSINSFIWAMNVVQSEGYIIIEDLFDMFGTWDLIAKLCLSSNLISDVKKCMTKNGNGLTLIFKKA